MSQRPYIRVPVLPKTMSCTVCNAPPSDRVRWSLCCAEKRDDEKENRHRLSHVVAIKRAQDDWTYSTRLDTALWAIQENYLALLQTCLEEDDWQSMFTWWRSETPLYVTLSHIAAYHGSVLYAHDRSLAHEVVKIEYETTTAADTAARNGHLAALQLLLGWGVKLHTRAILYALRRDDVAMLQEVCKPQHGVDLDEPVALPPEPLLTHAITKQPKPECARVLVDAGATVTRAMATQASDKPQFQFVVDAYSRWSPDSCRTAWVVAIVRKSRESSVAPDQSKTTKRS